MAQDGAELAGPDFVRDGLRRPFPVETSPDWPLTAPSDGISGPIHSPALPVSAGGTESTRFPLEGDAVGAIRGTDTTLAGTTRGAWTDLPGMRRSRCIRSSAR